MKKELDKIKLKRTFDDKNNETGIAVFYYKKRTDLKWYQKLWNIVTRNESRNYKWVQAKEVNMRDLL